jgi:hypothetical protein
MPCDPSLLAEIKIFELLSEDDRRVLARGGRRPEAWLCPAVIELRFYFGLRPSTS